MENIIKLVIAAGGAGASFLFGGWSAALGTLCIFILVDYITGLWAAGKEEQVSSKRGMKGIQRKVTIIFFVALAHQADQFIGGGHMLRDGAVVFFVTNEALSIIENASRIGVPIPPQFEKMLEQLKGKGNAK